MSTAEFSIESSPFSDRGFDATNGQVLHLKLAASPALDVQSCTYTQVGKSKGAPDLVFSNGGVASPPDAIVTATCPASGAHSYDLECQINGGKPVRMPSGQQDYSQTTKRRAIAIRTAIAGLRKTLVGESTQYSPSGGWNDAQNEMADQMEGVASAVSSASSSAAKVAVVAASTANVDLSATVSTINSIAVSPSDRVALFGQTAKAENGLYIKGVDNKLTRSTDADSSAEVTPGIIVPVQLGSNRGTWTLATTGAIVLGTTALRFVRLDDTVNVKLFGAVGDGTTDDTAAFVAAIAAAASIGHPLYVPPGTYQVTGLALSTAGLAIQGGGRSSTTIRLSASAAQVLNVTADDVGLSSITVDGGTHASSAAITTSGKRLGLEVVKLTSAPIGLAVAAGAGFDTDGVDCESVTTAAIQITDYADISLARGWYNTVSASAPFLKFTAGSTAAHDFVEVEHCKWTSSGDSMLLTCQQPVRIETSTFNHDAQVAPTATVGNERIVASENSFTNPGAVGFYDTGVPGTLSTYAGLLDTANYKEP